MTEPIVPIFGEGFSIPKLSFPEHPVPMNAATVFASKMHLGWNLGNTFDSCRTAIVDPSVKGVDFETCWRNEKTTREMLSDIRKAGFDTLRLPVSWHDHVSGPNFAIEEEWMDRIKEVVHWAMEEGFYIFLNTHHDIWKDYIYPTTEKKAQSIHFLRSVWSQISETFRDFDEHLIFEAMNEVRVSGTPYEWETDLSLLECQNALLIINELNQVFVDTVRSSGYRNKDRFLVVTEYANAVENALTDLFQMPKDVLPNHLLLAVHSYRPVRFAFLMEGHDDTPHFDPYDPEDTWKIDEIAEKVYEKFIKNGIPVVIDEFGAVYKENEQDRINYAAYQIALCRSYGISCHWWDNGRLTEKGDGMALYDRRTKSFPDRTIIEAMKQYSK